MSQRHKQRSVRIANPLASGSCWTSGRRAQRYVRDGQAVWLPDARLFFVRCVGRAAAAASIAAASIAPITAYDKAAWSGLAPIEAIRNLPVAGLAEMVLWTRGRSAKKQAKAA